MYVRETIVEAQSLLEQLCTVGYRQRIQKGEFAGEAVRQQAHPLHIVIEDPLNFWDLPSHTPFGVVEQYFLELVSPDRSLLESNGGPAAYTYGDRIQPQLQTIMDVLRDTPQTNQAVIGVGRPEDQFMEHKPCLWSIQYLVYDGELNCIVYFRTNDVPSAFVVNHGGLAMLQGMVAEYAGLPMGEYHYYGAAPHKYVFSEEGEVG
jgi:hypothetical protein